MTEAKKDPNEIWKKFQEFVEMNMDYWPEGWNYMDLNKHPEDRHDTIIAETLDFFTAHEKRMKMIEYWRKWKKENNK